MAASLAVTSTILCVALFSFLPVAILADAGHDDAWFWRQAAAIASGHWMGDYNQITLMKGAGYPLFLALVHALHLPLMTAQLLLHGGACLLLGSALYRMSGRPWLSLLVVLGMQWHPATLAWTRVMRDNIGAAQVLILLACVLYLLLAIQAGRRWRRWAVLSGLACAWFWCTREDGIWMLPGVAILLSAGAWQLRRDRGGRRRLAAGMLLMLAAAAGGLSLVAGANLAKYGTFVTVDTKDSAYRDAIAALQRVRVGEPVAYVPVPRKVRNAVYAVSPAFARLRGPLDGDSMRWKSATCSHDPQACGDYAGGKFVWALRDAAASIGVHASAPEAEAYYRQVADEVERACDDGRLACDRGAFDLMPSVTMEQWRLLPARLGHAASLLAWQGLKRGLSFSHAQSPRAHAMWRFVGRPKVPDPADKLGDWIGGAFIHAPLDWIRVRCAARDGTIAIERLPDSHGAANVGDAGELRSRFAITVPDLDGCAIESTTGVGVLELSALASGQRVFALGSGRLSIDRFHAGLPSDAAAPAMPSRIQQAIRRGAAFVVLPLAAGGVLAFAWLTACVIARRRDIGPLYVLAAAAWCLVVSRALLLALVDISAFPAINVNYLQPAFPLVVLAAMLSLALVVRRERACRRVPPGARAADD